MLLKVAVRSGVERIGGAGLEQAACSSEADAEQQRREGLGLQDHCLQVQTVDLK